MTISPFRKLQLFYLASLMVIGVATFAANETDQTGPSERTCQRVSFKKACPGLDNKSKVLEVLCEDPCGNTFRNRAIHISENQLQNSPLKGPFGGWRLANSTNKNFRDFIENRTLFEGTSELKEALGKLSDEVLFKDELPEDLQEEISFITSGQKNLPASPIPEDEALSQTIELRQMYEVTKKVARRNQIYDSLSKDFEKIEVAIESLEKAYEAARRLSVQEIHCASRWQKAQLQVTQADLLEFLRFQQKEIDDIEEATIAVKNEFACREKIFSKKITTPIAPKAQRQDQFNKPEGSISFERVTVNTIEGKPHTIIFEENATCDDINLVVKQVEMSHFCESLGDGKAFLRGPKIALDYFCKAVASWAHGQPYSCAGATGASAPIDTKPNTKK